MTAVRVITRVVPGKPAATPSSVRPLT